MSRASALAVAGAVALAALGAACSKPSAASHTDAMPEGIAPPRPVPEYLPPSLSVPDYVGAAECAECHRAIYDAWKVSPHGRSMAAASSSTVLANFEGSLALSDGTVSFSHSAEGYFMDLQSASGRERRKVDVVVASGRQHQLYAVRSPDGCLTLLPVVWSTKAKEWLPLSLYQPGDLNPTSAHYWGAKDMTRGCVSCHLSQAYRQVTPEGAHESWVDLSINCENCHGPGREHVRRRRAGDANEVYGDLSKIGSVQESRVCGGCHGFQLKRYVFPHADDGLPQVFVTSLINESLRSDGTQHLTSYQYPAHVLSAGFKNKSLECKNCHEPHDLKARNTHGESAEGEHSNRQCQSCHENLVAPASISRHTHHRLASARCVDCHMSYSWIGDDDRRHQRTSDHSISIPHPQETLDFGNPNACTTCHEGKSPEWALAALKTWGAKDALGVRDWVQAVTLGRKRAPGATEKLVALLTDSDSVTYLKLSALDLLAIQPAAPAIAEAIAPFARDPDPGLRASAIRALDVHDAAHRAQWRTLGLGDSHPFVRMETFSMINDVETLAPAAIDQDLSDVLLYMSPPTDGLVHLITVRHRRGELRQALELLDVLQRVSLPRERANLNLDAVRERITTAMAKQP